MLAQADFVSLHCPGGGPNRHLIDAARLAAMPPHAYLINTARGDVVDEAALVDALQQVAPGSKVDYLLKQRGMFSYTGFSAAQVDRLRDEFGVYLIASGRMCVAGLNSRNVQQVAKAFAAVM